MKKNAVLALITSLLLGYIYFFIEREDQREYQENQKKSQLVDFSNLGAVKGVVGKNFKIISIGKDRYVNGDRDRLLNSDSVDYFFSQLLKIKVLRRLETTDESMFIPQTPLNVAFEFEKGVVQFFLGNRTNTGDQFYMKVLHDGISSIILCKKEGSFSLKNEKEKVEAPYRHISRVFELEEKFFFEKKPFMYFENIENVTLDSFRNTKFSIDVLRSHILHDYGFNPEFLKSKIKAYPDRIKEIEAIKVTKNDGLLSTLIGELVIDESDPVTVYRKFGDLNGYFILLLDYVYEIDSQSFRTLFAHPQDFIDKKISATKLMLNHSDFSDEDLLLLMNKEAHMLTPLYEKEIKRKTYHLRTDKGDYYLEILESDTILYDFSKKIAYHYLETLK